MSIYSKIMIYNKLHNILTYFQKNNFMKYKNHLGRWNLENDMHKINIKVDLSNEDHCGICNEYSNNVINNKNQENIKYENIKYENIKYENIKYENIKYYLLCETPDYKK